MKLIINLNRASAIVLALLLLVAGCVQPGTASFQADSATLARWQNTFDGLRDMTPTWGKQGVTEFKTSLDFDVPMVMLDVRTEQEWQAGIIKNALLININELPKPANLARLPEDRDAVIGVYCSGGYRSTLALALLHQLGYKNVISMEGGMDSWLRAGYPVTSKP
jgi:rhodanese-related sulfurtransferase